MITKICDNYISNRAWFRDVLTGQDVILRGISALEYLQLFDRLNIKYNKEKYEELKNWAINFYARY